MLSKYQSDRTPRLGFPDTYQMLTLNRPVHVCEAALLLPGWGETVIETMPSPP